VPKLLETLARELERPREVTAQVARHLAGNYGTTDDEIGAFLVERLPILEADEVDLILSPLFTPKLDDQAIFADLLGSGSVPGEAQMRLVAEAVARPTNARLVTADDQTHRVQLEEVTVERYVYRLRLEGAIPEPTFGRVRRFPSPDRAMLMAVARRAIWESDGRGSILDAYLEKAEGREDWGAEDARALLDLVERYKPADIDDFVGKIPHWRDALEGDLRLASGGKPFFSQGIEHSHGGPRDQRSSEDALIEAKRREVGFLERLEPLLAG
jgi:hypothetical protein